MAEPDEIAISVQNVNKTFKLPNEKNSSIKGALINFASRKKGYETQQALKDINFEIKKGEFFGIVGRNGSGKSTLLKLLAGIYTPDSGNIQINGKLVPFIELGVGFSPELTGRENVFLNGALLGFSRKEMTAMYKEIVEFAELERFMDQKLKNYSSGMQVRLAFSIAIRAQSDILVLDEVLAVGDANFQKKCYDYFRKLKAEQKTVILVSHDMEAVQKFSDRALMLEKGKIVRVGSPEEVSNIYIQSNIEKETRKKQSSENGKKTTGIIQKVQLLDKSRHELNNLVSGEPINIAIAYDASQAVDQLNFGVGLYLDTGGYVFSYNTLMDKYHVSKKKGTLMLTFDNLPILRGNYYLNVVCFGADEAVPLEFRPRILSFDISALGTAKLYRGLINIEHGWSD